VVFLLVTIALALFKKEDPVGSDDPDMDVRKVYSIMWSIIRLKSEFALPRHTSFLTLRTKLYSADKGLPNRYPVFPPSPPSL